MSEFNTTPQLILLPAVDVADGKAVRLTQGEVGTETNYGDPVEAADDWAHQGAEWIHLVDLDAAFGRGDNHAVIRRVIRQVRGVNIELSGGIRDDAGLERALATGAKRINLGTAALENPEWAAHVIAEYGESIAVGLDVRGNTLAAHSGFSRAAVPRLMRLAPVASARSKPASSRMPPDSSMLTPRTWRITRLDDGVVITAPEGGVEIDEVDPLRALACPVIRSFHGVAVVRFGADFALRHPHGFAVGDVDGRQQNQLRCGVELAHVVLFGPYRCSTGDTAGGMRHKIQILVTVQGRHPVGEQPNARKSRFFGVELGGGEWPVLHCGEEAGAVFRPGQRRSAEGAARRQIPASGGERVHEIEPFAAHAGEQCRVFRGVHGVPADVRQNRRLQFGNDSRPLPQPRCGVPALDPRLEQDLHPHADAQDGATAGKPSVDEFGCSGLVQRVHDGGEGADSWNDQTVGGPGLLPVSGQFDLGAGGLECFRRGVDVPASVVEDDYGWSAHLRAPLSSRGCRPRAGRGTPPGAWRERRP